MWKLVFEFLEGFMKGMSDELNRQNQHRNNHNR